MATQASKSVTIGVRVPADLAQWLKAQAEANHRTVSNQALFAMAEFKAQQDRQQPEGAAQ